MLSDFQGVYINSHGISFNGCAVESAKSCLPHPPDQFDTRSDIFTLGSAIFKIMTCHEPFPDLGNIDDEEEIEKR